MPIHVEQHGNELVIQVRVDAEPADTLVAIAKGPLAAYGLELKPVLRLIDDGHLKTVAIGRRRFTKLSYLLKLVDTLPRGGDERQPDEVVDALRRHVERMARKDARAAGLAPPLKRLHRK